MIEFALEQLETKIPLNKQDKKHIKQLLMNIKNQQTLKTTLKKILQCNNTNEIIQTIKQQVIPPTN